jgi:hypothetical protein
MCLNELQNQSFVAGVLGTEIEEFVIFLKGGPAFHKNKLTTERFSTSMYFKSPTKMLL